MKIKSKIKDFSAQNGCSMVSDEVDFQTFQSHPAVLDDFLQKLVIGVPDGMKFVTFPKYWDFQETWTRYYEILRNNFHFEINREDEVVDIGSHHGIVALNCAYLGARVIAYEPQPVNFEVLKRNVSLNPALNICIENKAVFSRSGIMKFNFGKTSTTGALSEVGRDWKRTTQNIDVETVNYADLLQKYRLDKIKLMKIDCEGGEYEFLMNEQPELLRRVEYYYIEVHPTQSYEVDMLKDFLMRIGYEVVATPAPWDCFDYACRRIDT